jgi:threonine aldolase
VAELAAEADSVMFCLSKGLSAPVGSVLCGSAEFVDRARRARKMLGGGMRQAGVLAAAGIIGLTQMVERLVEDHANARMFAQAIAGAARLRVRPEEVESNFVFFAVLGDDERPINPEPFIAAAKREGVLLSEGDEIRVRAATHYGITPDDVRAAAEVVCHIAARDLARVNW